MRKGTGSAYGSDNSHVVPHYHVNVGDTNFRLSVLRHTYVAPESWKKRCRGAFGRATLMQLLTKLGANDDWPCGNCTRDEVEECMLGSWPMKAYDIGFTDGSRSDVAQTPYPRPKYFDRPKNWRYYSEEMERF
ncbi:hypothetical protein GJ744_005485 [Endocarpon pusillum]|uniref:Uncharacterized protein n=1 Tax=Endocarpon pusillum TaxID=364733 RepID=A0A8H7A8G1_9EURO|nr:hypothetical protein GJ744_005485 [Endocarpon pusillum]